MNEKVRRFSRATHRHGITMRLERSGCQPAGSYGFQVHGMFGQQLNIHRSRLGQTCAAATRGMCL
eukprot:6239541-Pyramimonas_sp.AAC.1